MNVRTSKFRVWDGLRFWRRGDVIEKYNEILKLNYKQSLILNLDGEVRICQWYPNGLTMHDFGIENYVIQQFTGLKDVKEREIYE